MTSPEEQVAIRDAATVVILRDGPGGPETFMLRRNRRTVFGPGAHVFPGGAVDRADAAADMLACCDGLDDAGASAQLGIPAGGAAFWIAAIRECFEEAGVLLATDDQGRPLPPDIDLSAERAALNAGQTTLRDICHQRGLRLPLDRIVYYNHWITPPGEPRRFSTRFFACPAPAGQAAVHDGQETVAGRWLQAAEALALHERGELPMMPPTVLQLRFLAEYPDVAGVMSVLRDIQDVPAVSPTLERDGDGFRVLLSTGRHD